MNSFKRQRGASLLGTLIVMLMAGFFVMCAVRMVPVYFEYLSVKDIVETAAVEHKPETAGISNIRSRLQKMFNTNQIYALKPSEVEVYREDGETYIDASYEVRIPIFDWVDAVLKFDQLVYRAGVPLELQSAAGSDG